MFTSILIFLFLFGVKSVHCTASNSLSDCNTVASRFYATCGGVAVTNITATTGTNVSCSSGFTVSTCPGTMYGSTCVFAHKLCVTCSGSSTIRIRVQTNGLPRFCPNVPATLSELNIDFEVNFNPDVSVNSPVQSATTSSGLSSILCNIVDQSAVPSASNYVSSSSMSSMGTLAGVSIDGVSILNVNSANNVDPFYPAGGFSAESVDSCLGHPNPSTNGYHYHIGTGCAFTSSSSSIATCTATSACISNIANYSISTFSSYRTLTVVGIAKDGHVIYGPYTSAGVEVTSGFDICNGMFFDSIGNYGYFVTRTYPYITGCFGPGNYPTGVSLNCTTNGPTSYTKSSYATSFTTSNSTSSSGKILALSYMIIILAVTCTLFVTSYEILVYTGDEWGTAGTDSQVYITLFGINGKQTQKIHLKNPTNNKDPFKCNQIDKFHVQGNNIGELLKLRIEHDNTGRDPSWFIDRIVLTDLDNPTRAYFAICNRWLAKNKDDGQISREFILINKSANRIGRNTQYRITVYTGSKRGPKTDAAIFITLYGTLGETGAIMFDNIKQNNFQTGQKDEFMAECPSVGVVNKILIAENYKGSAPDWYLEKVIIEDLTEHCSYEFPYYQWLRDGEIHYLPPPQISIDYDIKPMTDTSYKITVYTGDKRNAGTNARVYLIMQNGKLVSNRIFLTDGKFEQKSIDKFTISALDGFSPLTVLYVGHDNTGFAPAWFLDKVVVGCPFTGIKQTFPCNNWLADSDGDKRIERQLYEDFSLRQIYPPTIPWYIWVFTNDKKGLATNDQVVLVLYGTDGKSRKIKLQKNADTLQTGHCDQYKADIDSVGIPFKLRVSRENKGPLTSWHLNQIEMENLKTRKEYIFRCGRWFSKTEDDKQIIRELPAEGSEILRPLPIVKYMVDVYTGNKIGAGTDANVFINIYGECGDTGKRPLEYSLNNKNKFEKNQVDHFIIEAVCLKEIECIQIGHDGTRKGAGWFLDKVIISPDDQHYKPATFICNRWLAIDEDDGQIVRKLTPSIITQHIDTTTYNIKIKTGDNLQAGTDADVYLQIFGDIYSTEKIPLIKAKNKFERGSTDDFTMEFEYLGKIGHIIIGHNGKYPGAGWFLDWIEIHVPTKGEIYKFPCHRWLDKNEGDGKIELDLLPGDKIKKPAGILYEITVFTGDQLGAGTDAKVFIQLFGLNGKTNEIILESQSDAFERKSIDKFQIEAPDIGQIQKIRIGHNSEKFASAWYLEKICIHRHLPEIYEEYWFICRQWLDASKGDKQTVRELLPSDENVDTADHQDEITYVVHVFTGDKNGAGTDANVFLLIYGEYGDSGEHELTQSKTNKNKFEKKQEDIFDVKCEPLGKLKKINIRHDDKGLFSAWYLDRIEIVDPETNIVYYFICQKWLSMEKNVGIISYEIPAWENLPPLQESPSESSADDSLETKTTTYRTTVTTGDKLGSGTNANVYIIIFGEYYQTGKIPLTKSLTNKDPFENGKKDLFDIETADIGEPKKIKIGHDNAGLASDWLLESVEIEVPTLGRTWIFPYGKWLNKSQPEVELLPKSPTNPPVHPKYVPYEIKVFTSKIFGAGTDANVYIEIFGVKKTTGEVMLGSQADRKGKFQQGSIDNFVIELEDVDDDLKKIRIGHDNRGLGSAWHLDHVEITRLIKGQKTKTHIFPCNRWFAKNEDDGQIVRELICDNNSLNIKPPESPRQTPNVQYKVDIITSDKQNAGTTQNGWIIVEGSKKTSTKISLKNTSQLKILRSGQTDTFTFECQSLGELRRLIVGHEERREYPLKSYKGHEAMWHVSHIIIVDLSTGTQYEFPIRQWIAINNQGDVFDCASKKEISGPQQQRPRRRINYGIYVYTGDVSRAGTDANVSIILYGTLGDTGNRPLKQKGRDLFERGQMDQFIIESLELGQLTKLHIEHDNKGFFSPSWFLDRVEVINMDTSETVVFPCNQWLAKNRGDHRTQRDLLPKPSG